MKNFLKKIKNLLGINPSEEVLCINCKRKIKPDQKICPFCSAWNDCCSLDPRLFKDKKQKKK